MEVTFENTYNSISADMWRVVLSALLRRHFEYLYVCVFVDSSIFHATTDRYDFDAITEFSSRKTWTTFHFYKISNKRKIKSNIKPTREQSQTETCRLNTTIYIFIRVHVYSYSYKYINCFQHICNIAITQIYKRRVFI